MRFWSRRARWPCPERCGSLTVYTAGQSVYDDHREIVRMLGVDGEKVRVISKFVGGGFGGKEDMSVQHHAALLAWQSGRPVKLTLSRDESLRVHPKRHPMEIECTTACDENGKLTAARVRIVADTGAYASLGGPVLQRACTHAAGPYQIDNVDIEGRADLHQQHSVGRLARVRRDADLLRHGEQPESAGARRQEFHRGRFASATPSSRAACSRTDRSPTRARR